MKSLIKFFKKPLILGISVGLAELMIFVALVGLLIIPKISSFRELSSKNSESEKELVELSESITTYSKLDPEEIKDLVTLVDNLIPEERDVLRFLTLNEVVAQVSGVEITDTQIVSATATPTTPASSGSQAPAPATPSQPVSLVKKAFAQDQPQPQASPATPAPQVSSTSSYSTKISVTGPFNSVINYIKNFDNMDRFAAFSQVDLSLGEGSDLIAVLDVQLPLSKSSSTVASNEFINLTDQEKKIIEEVKSKILYSASPARNPLGKSNPFQ
ncbi:MAG: hypothetical protein WD231_03985 [Candidatus Woykebacteria bacterium]